jgi:hypothetical protein
VREWLDSTGFSGSSRLDPTLPVRVEAYPWTILVSVSTIEEDLEPVWALEAG